MKEKVGSEFYKSVPKYYRLYDTFEMLDVPAVRASGGKGAPGAGAAGTPGISQAGGTTDYRESPAVGSGDDAESEVDVNAG